MTKWPGIRTFPYRFDWGNLPEIVQSKIFSAQSEARRDDLSRLNQACTAAGVRAAEERAWKKRCCVPKSMRFFPGHIVTSCAVTVAAIEGWNAYELDRRREDARSIYLEARRKSHVQFDEYIAQEMPERTERIYEKIGQGLIPQTDLMVYLKIGLNKPA